MKQQTKLTYELPNPGTYKAVLIGFIDLGRRQSNWAQAEDKKERTYLLQYVLPEELNSRQNYFTVSEFVNNDKLKTRRSVLNKSLEKLKRKPNSMRDYIGSYAILEFGESKSGKLSVTRVVQPLKNQEIYLPNSVRLTYFTLSDPDWDIFEDLSPGIQRMVAESQEYRDKISEERAKGLRN